ncbi:hypothetical protein P152DRAFT_453715 [Eremomyces bilateralis CBS 781.70]|uniref:Peptidase S54 rhomboid domain-containing protein n=1 Tax=Eremomyces bilateralis CBS 781.70 TaxID=1392243 RepID=A0A6G1GG78_9PEZI|nr:uncharacterized protein P152DRAFT_453715 [Eremomyces bilateralis CBS 781.70]KAF1817107.1 hypothetical protein P152DRAFT_453715 [Eremomyces bilateralis CBS 781.70]
MNHVLPIACRAHCIPQPSWICRTSVACWRQYALPPSHTSRWPLKALLPQRPAYGNSRVFTSSSSRLKRRKKTPTEPAASQSPLDDPSLIRPPASTLHDIFGPEIPAETALSVVNKLQLRRTNGSLVEKGVYFPEIPEDVGLQALAWLREQHPMDEEANAQEWLARELESAEDDLARHQEEELTERARSMGIYKPEEVVEEDRKDLPEGLGREKSVLEAVRQRNEERWEKEQEEKRLREEEENRKALEQGKSTSLAEHGGQQLTFWEAVKKANPEKDAKKQKYYEEAILTKDTAAPNQSRTRRLLSSTVLAALITGGSVAFAYYYEPAPQSERLFPETPPSAATLLPIIGLNVLVFVAWRRPELWRLLNKYFVEVPGAPRAASVILSVFSHQRFFHLAGNMFILWHFGTQLHDATNRGFVLPLFLSAGVLSSLGSLYYYSLRSRFNVFSMGASGAVFAFLAAFHMLDPYAPFQVSLEGLFFKEPGVYPAWGLLATIVAADQVMGFFVKSMNTTAHLGGVIVGIVGVWVWKDLWGKKISGHEERRAQRMRNASS